MTVAAEFSIPAIFAEFLVGSLLLVPMTAGRRRKPVEASAAPVGGNGSHSTAEALQGSPWCRAGASVNLAIPTVADFSTSTRPVKTLAPSQSRNGCPNASQGLSGALRALPEARAVRAGVAP